MVQVASAVAENELIMSKIYPRGGWSWSLFREVGVSVFFDALLKDLVDTGVTERGIHNLDEAI